MRRKTAAAPHWSVAVFDIQAEVRRAPPDLRSAGGTDRVPPVLARRDGVATRPGLDGRVADEDRGSILAAAACSYR